MLPSSPYQDQAEAHGTTWCQFSSTLLSSQHTSGFDTVRIPNKAEIQGDNLTIKLLQRRQVNVGSCIPKRRLHSSSYSAAHKIETLLPREKFDLRSFVRGRQPLDVRIIRRKPTPGPGHNSLMRVHCLVDHSSSRSI